MRVFARRDDWISSDGTFSGSHDEQGQIRPQYVADRSLYETDGTVKKEYLLVNVELRVDLHSCLLHSTGFINYRVYLSAGQTCSPNPKGFTIPSKHERQEFQMLEHIC